MKMGQKYVINRSKIGHQITRFRKNGQNLIFVTLASIQKYGKVENHTDMHDF
jgi:hypothetical protein